MKTISQGKSSTWRMTENLDGPSQNYKADKLNEAECRTNAQEIVLSIILQHDHI